MDEWQRGHFFMTVFLWRISPGIGRCSPRTARRQRRASAIRWSNDTHTPVSALSVVHPKGRRSQEENCASDRVLPPVQAAMTSERIVPAAQGVGLLFTESPPGLTGQH